MDQNPERMDGHAKDNPGSACAVTSDFLDFIKQYSGPDDIIARYEMQIHSKHLLHVSNAMAESLEGRIADTIMNEEKDMTERLKIVATLPTIYMFVCLLAGAYLHQMKIIPDANVSIQE